MTIEFLPLLTDELKAKAPAHTLAVDHITDGDVVSLSILEKAPTQDISWDPIMNFGLMLFPGTAPGVINFQTLLADMFGWEPLPVSTEPKLGDGWNDEEDECTHIWIGTPPRWVALKWGPITTLDQALAKHVESAMISTSEQFNSSFGAAQK